MVDLPTALPVAGPFPSLSLHLSLVVPLPTPEPSPAFNKPIIYCSACPTGSVFPASGGSSCLPVFPPRSTLLQQPRSLSRAL